MHGRSLVLVFVLGPSCKEAPAVPKAEHEALLQRLDAMEGRLDRLEDGLPASGTDARTEAEGAGASMDPIARPDPIAAGGTTAHPHTLKVRVTATGLELDGVSFTRADALARFRAVALAAPSTRLTVLTEPDVPYASVVDALDLAREAGLTDIAMSARIHAEGEGEGAVTAGL